MRDPLTTTERGRETVTKAPDDIIGHMDHVVRPESSGESKSANRMAVTHQPEELPFTHRVIPYMDRS